MQDSDTKVLTVGTSVTADAIDITVQDSGMGIPPDVLPNIFRSFFYNESRGRGYRPWIVYCVWNRGRNITVIFGVESDVGREN